MAENVQTLPIVRPIHNSPEQHEWKESYYGYTCACGGFIPFGGEPWGDPRDVGDHDLEVQGVCRWCEEFQYDCTCRKEDF